MDSAIICFVPADVALDMEKAKLMASRRSSLDPEHLNMMLFLNNSLNSLFNKWENVCCERRTFTKHDILAINVYHATSTSVIMYCKEYSG